MTTKNSNRELDGLDAEILLALIDQPTATTVALAQRLSVSRNTVQARLQKLNDNVLDSFQRRLSPRALGYEVSAFMNASIRQGYDNETMAAFREKMVQNRKAERKGNGFLCSFGKLSVIKLVLTAVNFHFKLFFVRKFGRNSFAGNDSEIFNEFFRKFLHRISAEFFAHLIKNFFYVFIYF